MDNVLGGGRINLPTINTDPARSPISAEFTFIFNSVLYFKTSWQIYEPLNVR